MTFPKSLMEFAALLGPESSAPVAQAKFVPFKSYNY